MQGENFSTKIVDNIVGKLFKTAQVSHDLVICFGLIKKHAQKLKF